jgi:hypothetical protein
MKCMVWSVKSSENKPNIQTLMYNKKYDILHLLYYRGYE